MAEELIETPVETQEVSEAQEEAPLETEEATEASTESEEEIVKSERGQKRIQELAEKANNATLLEKEKEELKAKLAELEPLVTQKKSSDPLREIEEWSPELTGDYSTDLKTIEERATKKALEQVAIEREKERTLMRDVIAVEDSYPELKKGSDNFDEDFSNEVVGLFEEVQKLNPDVRLKPFVDRLMRLRKASINKTKTQTTDAIMQQMRESAVTPSTSSTPQEKDPNSLSLKEIEGLVGIAE
jgi:hypothetical protein